MDHFAVPAVGFAQGEVEFETGQASGLPLIATIQELDAAPDPAVLAFDETCQGKRADLTGVGEGLGGETMPAVAQGLTA